MKLDRAKRTSKPKTNLSAAHAKQPNTTETRAQTSQNRTAKKLPNAAFWCPKERWNSTVQNAPPNQKPTSRQPMRNNQTPPRHEPKPAKTAPQNCLTLLSDVLKKDEIRPCKTHLQTKNQPLGSPCETTKHHLDTSPNQPKPHRKKTA